MKNVIPVSDNAHDVPSFSILIDNVEINSTYQVLSIFVNKEINRITYAKIFILDGDPTNFSMPVSESEDFIPGKKITIKVGRNDNNTQIFKGIITKHAIKIISTRGTELQIECHDEAIKMTISRNSYYYKNVTDSEVFDQLIQHHHMNADLQLTNLKHDELVQHHISDWDFLMLRSEANAMLVLTDDGTVKIFKPDTSLTPVVVLSYGDNIYELEAEMESRHQYKTVEAKSWDYRNQQLFSYQTSDASIKENGNIKGSTIAASISTDNYALHHSGQRSQQELNEWADGMMMRSRLSKIMGHAKINGYAGVKPGDMAKIEGVGERFNGNVFVTAVKHNIAEGVWETNIQFGLKAQRHSEVYDNAMNDRQTAGLVGAINGLQIGKVVQLQNDPGEEFRILVKIPVIDNNAKGIWTRVASLDAGNNRGAFFMPEVDDEVIVGFINDDPRDAIMLGMLHSSANPAPVMPQNANSEKGFTTRSKMHISFNDDTKTITIDTPAGNSIILDERSSRIEINDQNANKITMGPSGIKLESPMNIDIKAGANLSLSAGASLTISGVSVSVKADADVSIGGAMAKLAGVGITEISGGMVKIN